MASHRPTSEMARTRSIWINAVAAIVGALALMTGIVRLVTGFFLVGATWAVIGFLIIGWAVLDRRKFVRGTAESELDGGHTIE